MTKQKKILYSASLLVAILGLAETGLRIQQHLGPLIDLMPPSLPTGSPLLHHVPPRERTISGYLGDYTIRYDTNGVRIESLRPCDYGGLGPRVLFLGDSFMEGYDDAHTIPQVAWQHLIADGTITNEARFLNAGFWSYAPSIFVAQAKHLIPILRPTHVLVEIDETDLMDEWIRYRTCAQLDGDNSVVAVHYSPTASERAYYDGLGEACGHFSYIARLADKVRFLRLGGYQRRLDKLPWDEVVSADSILAPSREDEESARRKFAAQVELFETRVDDLLATLVRYVGKGNILLSYHPHYLHSPSDALTIRYNGLVANILSRSALKRGVTFRDNRAAFAELSRIPRGNLFLWPNDPFSHFTNEGMVVYGEVVADALRPLLSSKRE